VFGPDGYLYMCLGDGGAGNDPHAHGQSLETMLGKILRIDVDHHDPGMKYAIPKDNPFVGVKDARSEIWALGLRNVWRTSFDRLNGRLWAGDVGQNDWEEVDMITKGGNYGWNLREGFHKFPPKANMKPPPGPAPEHIVGELIDPVFDYGHTSKDFKCIIGGNVYRGKEVPELAGLYLFADYICGRVYGLKYDDATQKVVSVRPIQQPNDGTNMPIMSFGEDEKGEVYYLTDVGQIFRFRSAGK
jgi:glucose/arabinose dehydrogenase